MVNHSMNYTVILILCIFGVSLNPIKISDQHILVAEVGTFIKMDLFFNQIIPNGDQFSVYGYCTVLFDRYLNQSTISGHFNVILDLNWIEGVQRVNFSQDIESRKLDVIFYEGSIIQEILFPFSTQEVLYNPIYLDLPTITNQTRAWIWSYHASFIGKRTTIWGYQNLSVIDYLFQSPEDQLTVTVTYERQTGLLIYSQIQYQQFNEMQETISNSLIATLHSTNIIFDNPKDYSSLLSFLALTSLIVMIPLLTVVIWYIKRPKRIIIGGG